MEGLCNQMASDWGAIKHPTGAVKLSTPQLPHPTPNERCCDNRDNYSIHLDVVSANLRVQHLTRPYLTRTTLPTTLAVQSGTLEA